MASTVPAPTPRDAVSAHTHAWLLQGITGSVAGVLRLHKGRVSFVTDDRCTIFDVPLSGIGAMKVPWYYFGGGLHLTVGAARHRFSFVRPTAAGGELSDIPVGRAACRTWRSLLARTA